MGKRDNIVGERSQSHGKSGKNLTYFAGGSHGMGKRDNIVGERSQSHRKEWSSTTNACGGIRDELANEMSEVNPRKSGLPNFFTIFAEINKYNKYENKIEYTD